MKLLKTPLRYPGGKSRATTKIGQFLPNLSEYTEYREPFLGGGSVALYITKMYPDLNVWVNDLYEPLYNFWKILQSDGQKLRDELVQLKYRHCDPTSAKVLFLEAKEYLNNDTKKTEPFHRAVSFWVINKCSFSGLTESSSFSAQASDNNFTMRGIDNLPGYQELIKDWKITNLSYEEMLDGENAFVYLDPPYDIKDNLYGRKGSMHKGFDHDKFASDCDSSTLHTLISYNSSQLVKERFADWTSVEFEHTYTMRSTGEYTKNQKNRRELLLLNYGKTLST